jgi:hypothetical protein
MCHSKQMPKLKTRLSISLTSYNELDGLLPRRIPTPHRPLTAPSSSNKSSLKKEDSGKNGTATGHQQAKNYSTGLCKSLNSSSMNTKNSNIQTFLHGLTPTASTNYSLWKTTKKLKPVTQTSSPIQTPQDTWARRNAEKA